MPKKIFIGGLSATSAGEAPLRQLLSPFGTLVSLQVVEDEPASAAGSEVSAFGQTQGVVVTFDDDTAGERAIQELNGALIDGNTVTVVADSTPEQ